MENNVDNRIRTLEICALILIVSLYVVGFVSHGIIRHTIQTAPVWLAVWLGFRRSSWTKWAVLSPLVVWLLLMINIWLFLLGLPHLLSGTFTPIEIAMTITVGVAAAVGIATALRVRTAVPWLSAVGTLLLMACVQVFAVWVSLQRGVSRDPW